MSNKDYTVSADLKANTGKFKKAIKTAIQTLQRYEKTIARIKDVELKADDKLIKEKVKQAELALERIDGKKANATIDASTKIAETKLKNYEKALQFLDNKSVKTAIDLQDRLFVTKFNKTKAEINKLDGKTVNTELEVKNSVANNKIRLFKALLRSIPNRRKVRVDVDGKGSKNPFSKMLDYLNKQSDEFVAHMDRIAKSIRTFGTIGANMIKGTLLSSFSALIPIIASLVPAIMAVGNALSVVGGGAIGLAGSFAIAGAGVVGFGAMAISAIKMLEAGTLQASAATYAYKRSLEGVTSEWQKIIRLNADSIFGALSSALNGVQTTLKNLTPFLKGVSEAVNSSAQSFEKWVTSSSTAKKAFETMNTSGVKIFSSLLSAAGRFGDGFVNILTQFTPLFEFVANGLNNMGASFQKWANKVSTQNGIQKFIDYVKVNLPIIGKIFGDTFLGIFNLFKAFGSNSQSIFEALAQMASRFRTWSEQIAQSDGFKKFIDYVQQNGPTIMSLIGNIIMVLVNFGTAMAPIASVVLNVVTAITGFVAKLFETHPIVAQIIGLAITFAGVLMTWYPVLSGIVEFLGPLISKLGFLRAVLPLIGKAFSLLSGPIGLVARLLPLLGAAIGFLTSPIGLVIGAIIALIAIFVILWNKNEAFRNFIINLWNSIKDFFINLWTTLATIASVLWQLLLTTIVNIVISIQTWLTTTWQNILTFLSTLWNTLIVIATTIWNLLVSVIVTVITTILTVQQTIWNAILSFLQTIWNTVISVATTVWNTLVTVITTVLNAINSFVTTIWNAIYSFFASILSRISSTVSQKFSEVYRWISTKIQQAYSILSSILSNMWSVVSSKFSQIVSTVISKMVEFYNVIKQKVQDSLNAVVNFVGEFMDAGRNLIMGLVNGVKNAAGALIDAVTGAVSGAIDKAKSLLGIKSPSRVFKQIGVYTMQGLGIGVDQEGQNAVGSVVDVARQLTKAFNPVLSLPSISDATSGLNGLSGLSANLTTQIQHTHSFETSPRMKTVRIEMRLDNDAIYGIVNDKQAEKHSIFEM
ncbi:phage tail protein [Staphylococcus pseudintermedius]|nr:phage tail protein [Staphylococcus pseudintermedius]